MGYSSLAGINLAFFAATFIISLSRFRILDRAAKILCINFGLSLLAEALALYAAYRYHNNMPVYAIYNIVEMVLVCLYFNYSTGLQKNNIGIILAAFSVVIGVLNLSFYQPLDTLNNNFIYYEGILIIAMCMYAMVEELRKSEKKVTPLGVHFFVAAIYMIFWMISFVHWGLYEYLLHQFLRGNWLVDNMMIFICCIMNIALSLVFLKHKKKEIT